MGAEDAPDGGTEALGDPEWSGELQESRSRPEDFAAQSQAENTIRAYVADLMGFPRWSKRVDREWLPAGSETVGPCLGILQSGRLHLCSNGHFLLVGQAEALRRSELVALARREVEFVLSRA